MEENYTDIKQEIVENDVDFTVHEGQKSYEDVENVIDIM